MALSEDHGHLGPTLLLVSTASLRVKSLTTPCATSSLRVLTVHPV